MKKVVAVLVSIFLLLLIPFNVSAHPGGTDDKGGHYDTYTGKYHYHHGYPAHSHEGGTCPYDYKDNTKPKTNTKTNINPKKEEVPDKSSEQTETPVKAPRTNFMISFLKSSLSYIIIAAALFGLYMLIMAAEEKLERKINRTYGKAQGWILLEAILVFIAGFTMPLRFAFIPIWIMASFPRIVSVLIFASLTGSTAYAVYLYNEILSERKRQKKIHIAYVLFVSLIIVIVADYPINAAAIALVTGFNIPEFFKAVIHLSLYAILLTYNGILLYVKNTDN